MRLHFDLVLVRRLLDHSKAATERSPSHEQLYDGRFRRDGKNADLDNLSASNFPIADDVDPADTRHVTAYATEANPAGGVDAWWEVKRTAFGGDDGVVFLELPFAEGLVARGRDGQVCLELTPTQIEAVVPYHAGSAVPLAAPSPRRRAPSRRARRA